MAEPHELEERITDLIDFGIENDNTNREIARAVLAFVRQKQEQADAWATRELFGHWWLSHTAPQEK